MTYRADELEPDGVLTEVKTGKRYQIARHAVLGDFYVHPGDPIGKYRCVDSQWGNKLWVKTGEDEEGRCQYEFLVIDAVFTDKYWRYEPPVEFHVAHQVT